MKKHTPIVGIYIIRNVVNGKIYIGSSIRIRNRWDQHRYLLRRSKHHSKHLQSSWNKHGEDRFVFEILEESSLDQRISLEQHYIDTMRPEYNVCKIAASTAGVPSPRKGKTLDLSDETKFNMGSSWRGKSLPDSVKEKMSKVRQGRTKSEDWKNNIAESVRTRHANPTDAMLEGHKGTAKGNSEWRWVTNGVENRRVHIDQLDHVEDGYYRGRTVK